MLSKISTKYIGLYVKITLILSIFFLPSEIKAERLSDQKTPEKDIQRIEDYFNNITTVTSQFVQTTSNGEISQGKLYISKPGKLRIEYNPPNHILMVADGKNIFVYDNDLSSTSIFEINETPARILLSKSLKIGKDIKLTDMQRDKNRITITLSEPNNPDYGYVKLSFRNNPFVFTDWIVKDVQGIITTVKLIQPKFGETLDPNLFIFNDPENIYVPFSSRKN